MSGVCSRAISSVKIIALKNTMIIMLLLLLMYLIFLLTIMMMIK